jgi:hypothetical protein
MLNELLVLGQIPGTNFQITFNEILLVVDVALITFLLWNNQTWYQKIKYYSLYLHIYWLTRNVRNFKLQAKLIERTS